MRSRRHVEVSEETGIDLAPMLDFVLNLLIFFIITTSFVKEAGVKVSLPEALTAEHKDSGNILVAVRANGDIWIDKRRVDVRSLRDIVERMHIERPEDTVVIVGDTAAPSGVVTQIIENVRSVGIKEVSLGASSAQ
ncbi:MAG: ExbD/TolR family protein [Panacagrimonas sp.]